MRARAAGSASIKRASQTVLVGWYQTLIYLRFIFGADTAGEDPSRDDIDTYRVTESGEIR